MVDPQEHDQRDTGAAWRWQLPLLVLATLGARGLFVLLMPPAFSEDVIHWFQVAQALARGQNPYVATPHLNWPPFWMQIVWVIGRAGAALHMPFPRSVQLVLALVEAGLVVALYRLMKALTPRSGAVLWAILIGISLNPIAALLICQHGNFDVFVGLWVVLFMTHLILGQRSGDPVDFLAACFFLGLAILTKTVPLVLLPLLIWGGRAASLKARALGAALVFGPALLGMSIIYVLAPADVTRKVIAYRSIGGYFGISGLLNLGGFQSAIAALATAFPWALLAVLVLVAAWLWRHPGVRPRQIVLLAALLLAGVPALGPGYAPQYIYWYLPLLVATYAAYAGLWRPFLLGCYVVGALTYVTEYALFASHGCFLLYMLPQASWVARWSRVLSTPQAQTLVRLPLFLMFLALLAFGGAMVAGRSERQPARS